MFYFRQTYDLCYCQSLAGALAALGFSKKPNSAGYVQTAVAVFGDGGDGYFSHACIGLFLIVDVEKLITCIGVGNDIVDCHNNARYQLPVQNIMIGGIDALYAP